MLDLARVNGTMRSSGSKDRRIYEMWACKVHPRCFTMDHVDLSVIKDEAARCQRKCKCWRHIVIKVAQDRGEDVSG